MSRLLANKWQTPDGTILWSKHRHDMACHRDRNGELYFTDGGNEYVKTSLNLKAPMKNLCVYDNGNHKRRRNSMLWGKNYDKNMNLLPETQYILIKDLEDEHLEAILRNVTSIDPFYKQVIEDEIIYRENLILNEIPNQQ